MARRPPIDDRALRAFGIPGFGVAIPHLTGLFGPYGPRDVAYWLGLAWFVMLAALVWHANRWLLFKQREHVDWFGDPLQKVLLLLVGVLFGTLPVTIAMLVAWYRWANFASVNWSVVEVVTLTVVICVVFITHVYETVFLIKERESDLVRVARLESARAEAELEALRAQIDPHFLFNCLSALGGLIEEDSVRARDYTARLARVYRYILASRGRPLVLLREEIAFVQDYAELVAVRFGGAFHVRVGDGQARYDRYLLPPMAIQLVVENAVKHNELSVDSPIEVRVAIEDAGVVVSNARRPRSEVRSSPRIGLSNLAER